MTNHNNNLLDLALTYRTALPQRIREYLNNRGIPDSIVDSHVLGWNGWRITIPIYDRNGEVVYFKYAKGPDDRSSAPKMMLPPGAQVELDGWESILKESSSIVICEGEFERLVFGGQGF